MTDSALALLGDKPEETARVWQIISDYDRDLRGPVRKYNANDPERRLNFITTAMINLRNYGHNAKLSLVDQNSEIVHFASDTWMKSRPIKSVSWRRPATYEHLHQPAATTSF